VVIGLRSTPQGKLTRLLDCGRPTRKVPRQLAILLGLVLCLRFAAWLNVQTLLRTGGARRLPLRGSMPGKRPVSCANAQIH